MEKDQVKTGDGVESNKAEELSPEALAELREKRTKWFQEQLPLLQAQRDYFQLISEIEQYKLMQTKSQFETVSIQYAMNNVGKQAAQDEGVEHTITQEDLDQNPDLVGQVQVGEVVRIPASQEAKQPGKQEVKKSRTLKK